MTIKLARLTVPNRLAPGYGLRAGLGAVLMAAAGVASSQAAGVAAPASSGDQVKLAPHRAVYDMRLDNARSGSGVTDLSGRMVFEITGSACEGYTQNMRFVMETVNRDGTSSTTDMRSSSWEEGLGAKYRFNTSSYRDQELTEATTGNAARPNKGGSEKSAGEVKVELTKPKPGEVKIPGAVLFPVQHSKLLIDAAAAGKTAVEADLYDGSEKGEKVYATTAVIGKAFKPDTKVSIEALKNAERLDGMLSWPVAISYFEKGREKEDALPVYEIAFRYFTNGVSQNLLIDYGDFSIKGALKEIEFYDQPKCDAEKK